MVPMTQRRENGGTGGVDGGVDGGARGLRLGLFCIYENPDHDYRRAHAEQTRQVLHAEALGFDEIWVAEHHFNPDSVSPSILALLTYLAGITQRVRLGSAAVLLAFRDPIQVAEDVATLDILSGGRFDFGVAKGGPFPSQNKHFGVSRDDSRERMLEALELIQRLLREDSVDHQGPHYQVEGVRLAPKPLQAPLPTWVATTTESSIAHCAERGYGLMGASPFPLERVRRMLDLYRATAPGVDPRLALSRFYFAAPSRDEALAQAVPFIRRFAERMKGIFAAQQPELPQGFDEAGLIERSLIGSYAEVAAKVRELEDLGVRSLLLKPASLDFERCRNSLTDFVDHVYP